MIDDAFLEIFFQTAILPHYKGEFDLGDVEWLSHGKVNLDSWAHYFKYKNIEYALVYEDFPGNSYLADGLTHELVLLDNGDKSLELNFNDKKHIENITGWYTLFKEHRR